jgi:hypothetical protein
MIHLLHRISNNLIVLYTNDKIKTNRSIKYAYTEIGVKYYFLTDKGLNSLNIKNPIYIKRNCSTKELHTKLIEIFNLI